MLNLRPEIHFKNLPAALAADLAALRQRKFNEDVESEASIKLLEGKALQTEIHEAKGETWHRKYRPLGVSLDDPDANFENSLCASEFDFEGEEFEEKIRVAAEHIESLLNRLARGVEANDQLIYGAAALAYIQKIGIRRAEQMLKALRLMMAENRAGNAIHLIIFWGGE